jgi:hypothetical protein
MKREMIRVSWEQREFHGDETLLHCFPKFGCIGNSDMKSPLRLA